MPDGGTVSTTAGETVVYTCPGDGVADMVSAMTSSTANSNYSYIVTDGDGTVVGLPPGNTVNVEGAGVGNCRIYGVSYTGNLTVQLGDDISSLSAFSDECSSISSNFILTARDMPDGGTVSTTDGATVVKTCPGDGVADMISAMTSSTANSNYAYIVTDGDGNVVGLPSGNTVDVEGAGVGNCRIYGVSYTGSLTVQLGDDVSALSSFSDECSSLSSNYILVKRNKKACKPSISLDALVIGRKVKLKWETSNFDADFYYIIRKNNPRSNRYYIIGVVPGHVNAIKTFFNPRRKQSFLVLGIKKSPYGFVWSNRITLPGHKSAPSGNNARFLPDEEAVPSISELEYLTGPSVYPNPAFNTLSIELDNSEVPVSLKITDLMGKEVLRMNYSSTDGQIDVSKLEEGLYLLTIDDGFTSPHQIRFIKK